MKFIKLFKEVLTAKLTNYSPGANGQTLANDVELHIADEVLRVAQRQLVAYQFGQPLRINKQTGVTYTATRYERLPLPFAPLSEGVAAAGEAITIAQVSATAQQWGDLVRVTDVADIADIVVDIFVFYFVLLLRYVIVVIVVDLDILV